MQKEHLSFLRNDTLDRLEWKKLVAQLSLFAASDDTKNSLKNLAPNLSTDKREELFALTEELISSLNIDDFAIIDFKFSSYKDDIKIGRVLEPSQLWLILILLEIGEKVQEKENTPPLLKALLAKLTPLSSLKKRLKQTVAESGALLDSASEELRRIRKNLIRAQAKIREALSSYMKQERVRDCLQDSEWVFKEGRYALSVKIERQHEISGVLLSVSQSGQTAFIEPEVLTIPSRELQLLLNEELIEIRKILVELSKLCEDDYEYLKNNAEILLFLDELLARTKFALALNASCPIFSKRAKLSVNAFKHPLLLLEKRNCVPNSINLEKESILILSGPNAGGKTLMMKTLGLLVLMAKAGLYIPASSGAELYPYEDVFVELGDRQDWEQELSSFSGHLSHLKKILSHASETSLVLIDEGFVGTDPKMGVSLAKASLNYLIERNSTVIFTTHYSDLKRLTQDSSLFKNGSMEFEIQELRPTYRFIEGIPGQSFAFELAERMNFFPTIVKNAKDDYGKQDLNFEKALKELQEKRDELQKLEEKQASLISIINQKIDSLEQEKEEFEKLKSNVIDNRD